MTKQLQHSTKAKHSRKIMQMLKNSYAERFGNPDFHFSQTLDPNPNISAPNMQTQLAKMDGRNFNQEMQVKTARHEMQQKRKVKLAAILIQNFCNFKLSNAGLKQTSNETSKD